MPRGVCVNHTKNVKLLSFAGGPWALGWHGPTKTHPSCCANVPAIFESWWGVANPGTTTPFFDENHTRIFEFSKWMDEGGFSCIFLGSWRNLGLRWISCPLQFSAYISEFFLASIDFIPFFKVATKEFSFHSTPNTLLFLSGVTGLFLHVRRAPQQNSQWQFWASVRVTTLCERARQRRAGGRPEADGRGAHAMMWGTTCVYKCIICVYIYIYVYIYI